MNTMEYRPLELSEDDKRFIEWQVYLSHKICEVFGIAQHELMGEGTEHSDSTVPSAPLTRWPSGKAF